MFFNLHISTKNYNSIKRFLNFFSNQIFVKKLNLIVSKQVFVNKTQKSVFTILKSPHVNKSAQEHFTYYLYSKQFKLQSYQSFSVLILIKILNYYLFPDVNVKIELFNQQSRFKHNMINKINSDNFCIMKPKSNLQIYINVLNNYGKLKLKT